MFAEHNKHYPSRSGQTSLAKAIANITKPVTKNNFGPSSVIGQKVGNILYHEYLLFINKQVHVPREMMSGGKRKAMMIAAIKGEEDFANLEKVIVTRTLIVRALWFVGMACALGGMETAAV